MSGTGGIGAGAGFGGTPIASVVGVSIQQREVLAGLGFTQAEQVVAAARVRDTKDRFTEVLGGSSVDFDAILQALTAAVGPAMAAAANGVPPPLVSLALGAMPPTPEMEQAMAAIPLPQMAATPLPRHVSHTAKMGQPKNQGGRGTCVAFAMTAVHEYFARMSGKPTDFSEQFLYQETKLIDGQPSVCGTWQVKAASVLKSLGQCLEETWRYNSDPPCNNNGVQPSGARVDAAGHRLETIVLPARDVHAIKSALAAGSVVGFSIPVYNSWFESEVVRTTGNITMRLGSEANVGGHAMCLIGYQDDAASPGGGFFILRNSWFGNWGTACLFGSGNGTIPYAYIANENWEAVTTPPLPDAKATT